MELLYQDSDICKLDSNNRRLYLTSEFNERGRLISNMSISIENADKVRKYLSNDNNKIIDSGVTDGSSNIALTKNDFAMNVLGKMPPVDHVCFEGFKGVFDKLKEVYDQPMDLQKILKSFFLKMLFSRILGYSRVVDECHYAQGLRG